MSNSNIHNFMLHKRNTITNIISTKSYHKCDLIEQMWTPVAMDHLRGLWGKGGGSKKGGRGGEIKKNTSRYPFEMPSKNVSSNFLKQIKYILYIMCNIFYILCNIFYILYNILYITMLPKMSVRALSNRLNIVLVLSVLSGPSSSGQIR